MNTLQPRRRAAILLKPYTETAKWPLALKTFALLTAIIITLMLLLGWTEYRSDYNAQTIEAKAILPQLQEAATEARFYMRDAVASLGGNHKLHEVRSRN